MTLLTSTSAGGLPVLPNLAEAADMLARGFSRLFSSSHPKPLPTSATTSASLSPQQELQHTWLLAAVRGDRGAAEQLLRSLLPRVRNLVRYFVRGDAEVDDLAQESLVTILRALGSFRAEGSVTAWADRIVVRTVFAHLRQSRARQKVHLEYAPDLVPVSVSESAQCFLARRHAMRALDELPDDQRDVVVMHHVMGLSVREIADELETAFETVRSRLRLGMARLRDALDGSEVSP